MHYVNQIKEVLNDIKAMRGVINDTEFVSKVYRDILPI